MICDLPTCLPAWVEECSAHAKPSFEHLMAIHAVTSSCRVYIGISNNGKRCQVLYTHWQW